MMMMNTPIKGGYIHVEPQLGNFIHGDGKLGTVPLQSDGQWDAFLPETHQQNENGFEPNDCVTESTINCTETLELQEYGTNSKWARRFLAKKSGTDFKNGNDPQTVSETLRTAGCTQATDYPFTVSDFGEFYKALTDTLVTLAIGTFAKFAYGHSWVNANPKDMMDALTYSPLSAAGYAWEADPNTGYYITPQGAVPEHDFMVYGYVANNYWKVRDSYAPFEKKLAWDYVFTGIKRHTLHRQAANTPAQQTSWESFWNFFRKILGLDPTFGGVPRSGLWPYVRAQHLKNNPNCAICGGNKKITVHHRRPYHLHPELELDPTNLITLCEGSGNGNHHLLFGHWGNFTTKYNPHIDEDVSKWLPRISAKVEDENL